MEQPIRFDGVFMETSDNYHSKARVFFEICVLWITRKDAGPQVIRIIPIYN
jgi:hypothetical protein